MMLDSIRKFSLLTAESVDSWRVFPRLMIAAYGYLVVNLYQWFVSIPTYIQYKCDPSIMQLLLSKGIALAQVKDTACYIVGSVGGPTMAQSAFVTTVIGLSTAVFGLYTSTGRRWEHWNYNPLPVEPINPEEPNSDIINPIDPEYPMDQKAPIPSATPKVSSTPPR
jgi:hypothetical protein